MFRRHIGQISSRSEHVLQNPWSRTKIHRKNWSKPINQSIDRSIEREMEIQSINQSIKALTDYSINQSINQSKKEWIFYQSINQSRDWRITQSIDQSINQLNAECWKTHSDVPDGDKVPVECRPSHHNIECNSPRQWSVSVRLFVWDGAKKSFARWWDCRERWSFGSRSRAADTGRVCGRSWTRTADRS